MSKKPIIPVEALLDQENLNALAGLTPKELHAKLHVIIYGRPIHEWEQATRMIPKRRSAKYPNDAVDIHHHLDNGTAIMASKSAFHGPLFPIYKKDLESNYRPVEARDFEDVKFAEVLYHLGSIDTGRYSLFPGYSDGSHFGELHSGYPFFTGDQLDNLVYQLDLDAEYNALGDLHIKDDDLGDFIVRNIGDQDGTNGEPLYWFNENCDCSWGRPVSLNELSEEDLKLVSAYDSWNQVEMISPADFDDLGSLSFRTKYDILSTYIGPWTFEKLEGSSISRFFELYGQPIQANFTASKKESIVIRCGDQTRTFHEKAKVSELVDGAHSIVSAE